MEISELITTLRLQMKLDKENREEKQRKLDMEKHDAKMQQDQLNALLEELKEE